MNKITKIAAGIALATCATVSTSAFADVSYNVGFASEYYFRGVFQKQSSASAGVDYEGDSGIYIGAWTADIGDGLEYDVYAGYGYEFNNGLALSAGYTGYFYTSDWDETYTEVNLGASAGFVSVEYAIGEQDNPTGADAEYTFTAVTLEGAGFYGTAGMWGDDFSGHYYEVGYGATVADIDLGVSMIFNDEKLSGMPGNDEAIIFTIGKSF